ncbi:hypothetical protein [Streptomyces sp. NBC_00576]|uniref:hypothetical protein n=1 Tax=Streptomyces sp. NBC_00576 TaxID=2903665 RepID=UPI002E811F73|nr:hypothetical protein [Streptomyces sp. NBC_00576]WUB72030.1 hypothetical protein OG734_19020 [Streptomyces sp. NBC_00576]
MTAPTSDIDSRGRLEAEPREDIPAEAQADQGPDDSGAPVSGVPDPRAEPDPVEAPIAGAQESPEAAGETEQATPDAARPEDPLPSAEQRDGESRTPAVPQVGVHAGINHGLLVGQWFEAVQRHSGAPLPIEWVDQQLADYLPIGNEDEAAKLLRDNQVLVLVADGLGSGRWTAALHLLRSMEGEDLTLRRVRRDAGDSFSMEGLRGRKRTGWILDLRATEESIPSSCDFGLELSHVVDLEDDGSYLVVLTSSELWDRIGHGAGALALTPRAPDPVQLFIRCLRSAGVTKPEAWADHHQFKKGLPRRPGQIRQWARAIAQSEAQYLADAGRGTELGDDELDVVAKAAGNALSDWLEVLAEWHAHDSRNSYERNYLLLAAVYDGAPVENVHRRIASLASAFGEKGEKAEPLSGQQGPGLIQLARQIKAELLPDGSLRFPGPGFAEAVVRYFWRDRPELINAFTKWTAQLCLELKHPQGTQLAERMAPWALHHLQATRTTRLLRLVATDWSADRNLAPHAHALLVAASLDPEIGQLTRNATGTWMTHVDTTAALQQTLARVFQSLAPAHPQQMLRRLGDLALSTKPGVADAVGEAVNHLWSDDELRPRLHATLTSWFGSDQETLRRAAASAFLNLTLQLDKNGRPSLLGDGSAPVPDWVVDGWRTVLEADDPSPLARRACIVWLDSAATRGPVAERVLTTLVCAVHDSPTDDLRGQRFLNLVRLAEHWMLQGHALDAGGRNELRTDLLRRTQLADPHRPRPQGSAADV